MSEEWKPGDLIGGQYRLVRELREERGTFGVVWLADEIQGAMQRVVIKIPQQLPSTESQRALRNEVALWLKAIPHPNILSIRDVLTTSYVAVVSPYISDGSLAAQLPHPLAPAPSGPSLPPLEQAVVILEGILKGLEHLHGLGIVHLDLKPANILMLYGVPQLMDFGLARTLDPGVSARPATSQAGTYHYMAPERFANDYAGTLGEQAYQSDLWSVGVIFHQLLTGKLPFPESNIALVAGQIKNLAPQPLPESVPGPYRRFVEKALQKDRHQRHKNATEMLEALRQATKEFQDSENQKILQASNNKRGNPFQTFIKLMGVFAFLSFSAFGYWSFAAAGFGSSEKLAWIHYHRGNYFYNAKQYKLAESEYSESARLKPDDYLYKSCLGSSFFLQGRYSESEKHYKDSIEIDSQNGASHADLAACLLRLNKKEDARSEALKAKGLGCKEHWVYKELGL
jgi:serine/threonine protein kinase